MANLFYRGSDPYRPFGENVGHSDEPSVRPERDQTSDVVFAFGPGVGPQNVRRKPINPIETANLSNGAGVEAIGGRGESDAPLARSGYAAQLGENELGGEAAGNAITAAPLLARRGRGVTSGTLPSNAWERLRRSSGESVAPGLYPGPETGPVYHPPLPDQPTSELPAAAIPEAPSDVESPVPGIGKPEQPEAPPAEPGPCTCTLLLAYQPIKKARDGYPGIVVSPGGAFFLRFDVSGGPAPQADWSITVLDKQNPGRTPAQVLAFFEGSNAGQREASSATAGKATTSGVSTCPFTINRWVRADVEGEYTVVAVWNGLRCTADVTVRPSYALGATPAATCTCTLTCTDLDTKKTSDRACEIEVWSELEKASRPQRSCKSFERDTPVIKHTELSGNLHLAKSKEWVGWSVEVKGPYVWLARAKIENPGKSIGRRQREIHGVVQCDADILFTITPTPKVLGMLRQGKLGVFKDTIVAKLNGVECATLEVSIELKDCDLGKVKARAEQLQDQAPPPDRTFTLQSSTPVDDVATLGTIDEPAPSDAVASIDLTLKLTRDLDTIHVYPDCCCEFYRCGKAELIADLFWLDGAPKAESKAMTFANEIKKLFEDDEDLAATLKDLMTKDVPYCRKESPCRVTRPKDLGTSFLGTFFPAVATISGISAVVYWDESQPGGVRVVQDEQAKCKLHIVPANTTVKEVSTVHKEFLAKSVDSAREEAGKGDAAIRIGAADFLGVWLEFPNSKTKKWDVVLEIKNSVSPVVQGGVVQDFKVKEPIGLVFPDPQVQPIEGKSTFPTKAQLTVELNNDRSHIYFELFPNSFASAAADLVATVTERSDNDEAHEGVDCTAGIKIDENIEPKGLGASGFTLEGGRNDRDRKVAETDGVFFTLTLPEWFKAPKRYKRIPAVYNVWFEQYLAEELLISKESVDSNSKPPLSTYLKYRDENGVTDKNLRAYYVAAVPSGGVGKAWKRHSTPNEVEVKEGLLNIDSYKGQRNYAITGLWTKLGENAAPVQSCAKATYWGVRDLPGFGTEAELVAHWVSAGDGAKFRGRTNKQRSELANVKETPDTLAVDVTLKFQTFCVARHPLVPVWGDYEQLEKFYELMDVVDSGELNKGNSNYEGLWADAESGYWAWTDRALVKVTNAKGAKQAHEVVWRDLGPEPKPGTEFAKRAEKVGPFGEAPEEFPEDAYPSGEGWPEVPYETVPIEVKDTLRGACD